MNGDPAPIRPAAVAPDPPAAGHGRTAVVLAVPPGPMPGVPVLRSSPLDPLRLFAGRPAVERVVECLAASGAFVRIVVVARDSVAVREALEPVRTRGGPPVTVRRCDGGASRAIQEAIAERRAPWPVLVTTAGAVLLTPAAVRRFLEEGACCDLAAGFVEGGRVVAAHPAGAGRRLLFRDGGHVPADLIALNSHGAVRYLERWERAAADGGVRGAVRRALARRLRLLPLRGAVTRTGLSMELFWRAVPLASAELGVDAASPAGGRIAEDMLRDRDPEPPAA